MPPGADLALGESDLRERAAQVHGAGPADVRVGPRHAALDREIHLERARSPPETAEGTRHPRRQRVTKHAGDRIGREVEQGHVGRRELRRGLDQNAGFDLAAEVGQQRGQRGGDRPGPAGRDRPAPAVAGGDDARADRRGERVVQRPERVRGHPAEQRASLLGAEHPREPRAGQQRRQPEPGQRQRMAGCPQQRPHDVRRQLVVLGRGPAEHTPPAGTVGAEARGGFLDGPVQQPGIPAVERVRAVDLRPPPGQPVPVQAEAVQERRAGRHRVEGRAVVVQQAGHQ